MSNQEHIDKKIADAFGAQDGKTPDLWNSISDELGSAEGGAIDHAVKQSFVLSDAKAPEHIWDGVRKQLLIDNVWVNLLAYFDRKRRRRFLWYRLGGAFVLLVTLVSLSVTLNLNNDLLFSNGLEKGKQGNDPSSGELSSVIAAATIEPAEYASNEINSSDKTNIMNNVVLVLSDDTRDVNLTPTGKSKQEASTTLENTSLQLHTAPKKIVDTTVSGSALIDDDVTDIFLVSHKPHGFLIPELTPIEIPYSYFNDSIKAHSTPFEIGLIAEPCIGGFLNSDVKNSLQGKSLISYIPSFSWQLGISGVYNISPNHGIQSNLVYSNVNQVLGVYSDASYNEQVSDLRMISLSLDYKYRTKEAPLGRSRFTTSTGLGVGYLFSAQYRYENEHTTQRHSVNPISLFADLSLGGIYRLASFNIEYGVQGSIGINNMSNNEHGPKELFDTRTFSIGPYVALRYRFGRKN